MENNNSNYKSIIKNKYKYLNFKEFLSNNDFDLHSLYYNNMIIFLNEIIITSISDFIYLPVLAIDEEYKNKFINGKEFNVLQAKTLDGVVFGYLFNFKFDLEHKKYCIMFNIQDYEKSFSIDMYFFDDHIKIYFHLHDENKYKEFSVVKKEIYNKYKDIDSLTKLFVKKFSTIWFKTTSYEELYISNLIINDIIINPKSEFSKNFFTETKKIDYFKNNEKEFIRFLKSFKNLIFDEINMQENHHRDIKNNIFYGLFGLEDIILNY